MKVVTIQSNVNIVVTSGLQHEDLTEYKSDIANRLKVKPTFSHVLIKKGQAQYPEVVASWPSVKALEKDKLLSIVGKMEIDDTKEKEEKKAAEKKAKLDAIPEVKTLNAVADGNDGEDEAK